MHVPWEKRLKSIEPMPGGVTNYLESLRWTANQIREEPIAPEVLAARMMHQYAISGENARLVIGFLKKVGFLRVDSDGCNLPAVMRSWLRDGDSTPLMVILHHKLRLIGEMLAAVDDPMKTSELHRWANDRYRTGWKSTGPIDIRVAWLRSAGLMRRDNLHLYRTDAGSAFLDLVVVEPPLAEADDPHHVAVPVHPTPGGEEPQRPNPPQDRTQAKQSSSVADLADRIVAASTDTRKPEQFESVVCEAFSFLGFDAEHLGGPGRTDVLLEARFGDKAGYRVVVDAKTTSHATLPTQQVVFDTLAEHREKHKAEFAMVVGPNPSARKLVERASRHAVPVMSAETLAELCIMHATQPLGLDYYRSMFEQGGAADTSRIRRRAEEVQRLTSLAKRLVIALAEEAQTLGPMTAAGLRISMHHRQSEADLPTEEEIGAVLLSLASPLVGAIQGDPRDGYVLACSPAVVAERLLVLGEALSAV